MSDDQSGSELNLNGLLQDGLRELIELVSNSGVTELQIERGETKLYIKSAPAGSAVPVEMPAISPSAIPTPVASAPAPAPPPPAGVPITSPIVGTFYAAARPGEEPFVQVGDFVIKGQTVGIIEAMKIMNEIESEVAGKIVDILVESGQAVEYGQTLMLVDVQAQPEG